MLRELIEDKSFFKQMMVVALPVAIQNLISSSLNMVDTVMIGQLGEESINAVGLANQFFFVLVLLLFGITSGTSIFIAQFWGKKDIKNIHKSVGLSIVLGVIGSAIFTALALFMPKIVMRFFSADPEVINQGAEYLKIVGLSYIITAVSFSYAISSRSVGYATLAMKASAISLIVNTVLNYILIFGYLGAPALGVKGAAIATVFARIVELVILVYAIYSSPHPLRSSFKELFDFNKTFVRRVIQKSVPVVLNEFFWGLGMTLYVVAYAQAGKEVYAAVQIAQTVERLLFVFGVGLASACGVMIGNKLGEGDFKAAIKYSRYFNIIAIPAGLVLGIVFALTAPYIVLIFRVQPIVQQNAINIIYILSFFICIKFVNVIQVIGVLRGGGDTTYSFLMEIGSVYLIGVPMAFLGVYYWKLPIYIVILLVSIEEVVKAVIGLHRLFTDKWANDITHGF